MKKVAVLGSNSFSGSHFIDLLLETEQYEVLGISRSEEKHSLFLPYKRHKMACFEFFQTDLNEPIGPLIAKLNTFKPEAIVNFAAQSEVGPSWENPDQWFQTNAVALTRLIHFLKDVPYLRTYVHISSPEVYGTCQGNVTEDAPLNPSTPYAASKAAADLSLSTYFKNFGFPVVFVRSTNVYGPGQQLFKIIPRSIIHLKEKIPIELHGGGVAVKSYIHIRDVSEGQLLIMNHGKPGEIYHLSPDHGISVKDVVALICNQVGASFNEATKAVPERLGQDKAYTIDSAKVRTSLGWQPKIDFTTGIEQTVQWIAEHFSEIRKMPRLYLHKP